MAVCLIYVYAESQDAECCYVNCRGALISAHLLPPVPFTYSPSVADADADDDVDDDDTHALSVSVESSLCSSLLNSTKKTSKKVKKNLLQFRKKEVFERN